MTAALLAILAADAAAAVLGLYLLPVIIGAARRVPDLGAVAVINVLLGWTLAGWAIALALALRTTRPGPPPVQVTQVFPATTAPRPGPPPPLILPPRPGGPGPGGRP
jgi:hypothetical protein